MALLNVAGWICICAGFGAALVGCAIAAGNWQSRGEKSLLLFLWRGKGTLPEMPAPLPARGRLAILGVALALGAAFGAGYGRARAETARFEREAQGAQQLKEVRSLITGRVVEIQEREKGTSLVLENVTARAGRTVVRLKRLQAFAEEAGEVEIGWVVELRGQLEETERSRNPGEFDFGLYSRSLGYCCQTYGEELRVLKQSAIPYRELIRRFKNRCQEILERVCDPQDLGVFQAVVLGDKSMMDQEIKEMYQVHGISHILAVSGQHLTIVGGGLYLVLRKMGFKQMGAGITAGILVAGYGILTGGSGSAMRAVVMILCLWLAGILGRSYDSLSALGLAAVILLWQRPYLALQSGFQLSFGAVWAIGGLGPLLTKWGGAKKGWQKTWIVSLSVQMALTPIVVWHYFRHPFYGIFLNLLVMPFAAGLIYSALGGIGLGFFSISLGKMAAGTGHFILVAYEGLCKLFERLPGFSLLLGRPGYRQLAAYGVFLCLLALGPVWVSGWRSGGNLGSTWRGRLGSPGREKAAGEVGRFRFSWLLWWSLVYFTCIFLLRPEPAAGLRVTFLDVGQGDGIVAEWEGGALLVDGGSSSRSDLGEDCLEPFLESRGISRIQCALVSHGDSDHISGLLYLLGPESGVTVENLVLPMTGKGQDVYEEMAALAARKGTSVFYMDTGDQISMGKLKLHCLYGGDAAGGISDRNKQSLAVDLGYGEFHMLLTGDMDQECESQLLQAASPETLAGIQLLKVAHHGSDTSSSPQLLKAVSPQAAVISYGVGNSYGHPSPQVVERLRELGIQVWETGQQGSVTAEGDGGRMRILGFL